MSKEYLIQCQAKNNTFQCNLDRTFRDLELNKKDLSLQYVNCNITSPQLGKITKILLTNR
jgi:hypothetical protein